METRKGKEKRKREKGGERKEQVHWVGDRPTFFYRTCLAQRVDKHLSTPLATRYTQNAASLADRVFNFWAKVKLTHCDIDEHRKKKNPLLLRPINTENLVTHRTHSFQKAVPHTNELAEAGYGPVGAISS